MKNKIKEELEEKIAYGYSLLDKEEYYKAAETLVFVYKEMQKIFHAYDVIERYMGSLTKEEEKEKMHLLIRKNGVERAITKIEKVVGKKLCED